MLTFCVPTHKRDGEAGGGEVRFSVPELSVLFAGSRFSEVPQNTCGALVERFARHNFSFLVGCADGVDCSFRRALAHSPYRERCFVACAFPGRRKRARSHGLFASAVGG